MRYSFDYFVGNMKCSKCGTISPADTTTNMQTKICTNPSMHGYGVGEKLELDIGKIEDSGYLLINQPRSGLTFKLLDTWECDVCNEPFNWALITIENSKITLVKEVEITDEIARCANYISDICLDIGYTIVAGKVMHSEK